MAPPNQRRPGHDRKAQYGLFVSYVIAVVVALVGLQILIISIADPAGFSALRATGAGDAPGRLGLEVADPGYR